MQSLEAVLGMVWLSAEEEGKTEQEIAKMTDATAEIIYMFCAAFGRAIVEKFGVLDVVSA